MQPLHSFSAVKKASDSSIVHLCKQIYMHATENTYIWRLLNFRDISGLYRKRLNINRLIFDFQYIYICKAYQREYKEYLMREILFYTLILDYTLSYL